MPAFPQVYVLLVGLARCAWVAVIVESNNVEVSNRRSDLVPSARAARARKTKSRAKRQRGEKEDDRLGERKKRRRCDGVGRRLRLRARRITSVRVPGTLPKPIAVAVRRGGGTPTDRERRRCLPVALFHHIYAPLVIPALDSRSINPSLLAAVCLAQCVHRVCLPVDRQVDLCATFRSQ